MKRILIVDDVAEIRHLVKLCARPRYAVDEAANAEEALFLLAKHRPDLVVLDVDLPGGRDGLDFLATMRRHEEFRRTRVLMLSGHGLQGETLGLPVDGYFTKPFRPLELSDCIDVLLRGDFPGTVARSQW